jgi:Flp pilus assembly protein TadD
MNPRILSALGALLLAAGCVQANPSGMPAATAQEAADARQLHLDLIRGLRQRGLNRAVIAHLNEFDQRHGASDATRLLRGEALSAIGDHAEAMAVFRTVQPGPEFSAAQQGMGLAAAGAGQWDEALALLQAAARVEPTNARLMNNIGFVQLQRRDFEGAERHLRTAAELDPENPEIRNNIALLLLAMGRRVEGERLLAAVPSVDARNAIRREGYRLFTRTERRS